jgi:hypothetical protein
MSLDRAGHQKSGQPERTGRKTGEARPGPGRDEARKVRQGREGSGRADLLEQALASANMVLAWKRVKANRGSAGVDGLSIAETAEFLRAQWPRIREALRSGSYRPLPVKRVQIPKPDGGVRELGIPCVTDRLIQQALLQVLQPLIDPGFSEHSHGFRPGRCAHDAVREARRYAQEGFRVVVDVDLEKFFDRVNHDILMERLSRRIADKAVLRLIRRYLKAGILDAGLVRERHEGTPQGGPLSPLLANVLLDEVDREPTQTRQYAFPRSMAAHIDVAVVGIANKAMTAPLQLPIHFIKQHIGQQGRQGTALRRPLVALPHQPGIQNPRLEVAPNQPQHGFVCDPPRQAFHQNVVIDPIEEFLQIHIDHHPESFLRIAPRLAHRIVRAASRAKAVTVFGEPRINQRLQHLQQSLLDQSIRHARNPQLPHPSIGLRNLDSLDRQRPVAARSQRFPNPGPLRSQKFRRLGDRQPIHSGTAAIGFDALPRQNHVRTRKRLLQQVRSPRAFPSLPHLPRFITTGPRTGFTRLPPGSLRLPGLLMPCAIERHGGRLSNSFGPSPPTGSYYGLC